MHLTKSPFLLSVLVFLLLGVSNDSHCQYSTLRKNEIGFFIPVNHYFDGTETNWGILIPSSIHSDSGKKVLPETIGLSISRALDSSNAITFSIIGYYRSYGYPRDLTFGQVVHRSLLQVGIGYSHALLNWRYLKISALSELLHRRGYEDIHISPSMV